MVTFIGQFGVHQNTTGYFERWTNISLTRKARPLMEHSEMTDTKFVEQPVFLNKRITKERPIYVSDNKLKMNLNNMENNVYYPIKYKNNKYIVGSHKKGVIDIYRVK